MFRHLPFGLTARGDRPLSCIASARIAMVSCGEYLRRRASAMMARATSWGPEFIVSRPTGPMSATAASLPPDRSRRRVLSAEPGTIPDSPDSDDSGEAPLLGVAPKF